jgi:hypothetical protein
VSHTEARPAAVADSGRPLRIAGLATAGAGVAALAAGAVFGLQARSKGDSVSTANRFDPNADSAGRRAQTLQYVFYGIGGAAVATGAVLFYFGIDRSDERAALAPVVTPGGFALVARGRFQ